MKVWMILTTCLFPVFTSCSLKYDEPVNKIPFDEYTSIEFKTKLCELNELFNELDELTVGEEIGYIIFNDTVRFKHCLDVKGNLLDSIGCDSMGKNINGLFNKYQKKRLFSLIEYFKAKKIDGTVYSPISKTYMLTFEVNRPQIDVNDGRYLFADCQSVSGEDMNIKPKYRILDSKAGLYLLSVNY